MTLRNLWRWLTGSSLTKRERIVLALAKMGGHGCALDIWRESGIFGAASLFAELDRMEDEGLLVSCYALGGPERNWRPRRSFGLTQAGWQRATLVGWDGEGAA